jgi:hypothetical protein
MNQRRIAILAVGPVGAPFILSRTMVIPPQVLRQSSVKPSKVSKIDLKF